MSFHDLTSSNESQHQSQSLRTTKSPRVSAEHLRFLYGDLGFSQATIAQILKTSIASVDRSVKEHKLKRFEPTYGEYNRAAFKHFSETIGKPNLTLPADLDPADVWTIIRSVLRAEAPQLFQNTLMLWCLDVFLEDVEYLLAAAKARLIPSRLWLLHDDLEMSARDISEILDVPLPTVNNALAEAGVERGGKNPHPIGLDGYGRLAEALGRARWPVYTDYKDSQERLIRKEVLAAREGVRSLALSGALDWSAVDRFLLKERER